MFGVQTSMVLWQRTPEEALEGAQGFMQTIYSK